ncbi:MAG TPA: FHA domain-containing protein [Phycisphaerae bacterium]|nr:FHA domain-containing protein [Phycisphaerae bacterium]
MATVLRCNSCGKLVRLASADGVVSIACPQCGKEIELTGESEAAAGPAQTPAAAGQASKTQGAGRPPAVGAVSDKMLTVVSGPSDVGKRVPLPRSGEVSIGSDDGAWLHLAGTDVESIHCLLKRDTTQKSWRLVNCSDRSGTWVNGRPVEQDKLRTGDVITLGPYELRIDAKTADPAGSAAGASGSFAGRSGSHAGRSGSHAGRSGSYAGGSGLRPAPTLGGLERVVDPEFPGLMASRYGLACLVLVFAGLLDGGYHTLVFFQRPAPWEPVIRIVVAAVPTLLMLQLALLVATPGRWRFNVAIGGLVLLAIADLCLPGHCSVSASAILRCMLAGGVGLMIADRCSPLAVASGTIIAWTAVACYLIGVVWRLIELLG